MPRRRHQALKKLTLLRGDGDNKARSPGRARRNPLKPLRRECRVNRCDRGDYARVLFYFAREAAGAWRARHSLRPLHSRGWRLLSKNSRGCRGGIVEACLGKDVDGRVKPGHDGRRECAWDQDPLMTQPPSVQHPLRLGAVERKSRHVDLELLAAFAHHLVTAGHEAGGGRQWNA
jgi:hypothetical protein